MCHLYKKKRAFLQIKHAFVLMLNDHFTITFLMTFVIATPTIHATIISTMALTPTYKMININGFVAPVDSTAC